MVINNQLFIATVEKSRKIQLKLCQNPSSEGYCHVSTDIHHI